MKYITHIIKKEEVAEGTMAFYFERPNNFEFKAGQSMDVTLLNPSETDQEGDVRAFSIASAPHEMHLMITTRMRDTAFKRVLKNSPAELEIEGPFGSFTLHENIARPAVFLVGGIGITPFYSMLKDAAERKLAHTISLFYSNRRPEDAAFLRELGALQEKNENFTFVPTMTEMENSKLLWTGERGYITVELLNAHMPIRTNAIYYAAGPRVMVTAMRKLVNDSGVSNDDIRTEEFSGY